MKRVYTVKMVRTIVGVAEIEIVCDTDRGEEPEAIAEDIADGIDWDIKSEVFDTEVTDVQNYYADEV